MSAWKLRLSVMVGAIGLSTGVFVCAPSVAAADIVTETFSFTASGLVPPGGPVAIQTGSFTLTFDPGLTYVDAPLDAISLTIAGHRYSLSDTGFLTSTFSGEQLIFGGLLNGLSNAVGGGADDFELGGLVDGSGNAIPGTWAFTYALASSPVAWNASYDIAGSMVLVQSKPASVTSVPEPPTIMLLCFALACVGLASRLPRRSRCPAGYS